jgi:hypothetical protein
VAEAAVGLPITLVLDNARSVDPGSESEREVRG